MNHIYPDATEIEINDVMRDAAIAFLEYKKFSPQQKAGFLETIALEIESLGDALIIRASEETNLSHARLTGERGRTCMQLRMFADMLREGSWVDATIITAEPERQPLPRQDFRKMLYPVGPVIVFGASNFPFAYSTAGGDTASALASGCPVVVKAHPAHPDTSESVYHAIRSAIEKCGMPTNLFQHVHGKEIATGRLLVQHPETAAVGFTGSLAGGRALYDYAGQRDYPIPVFAEMGSVNPVILFPGALEKNSKSLAQQYAASITLGMGQFCTNPGIIIAIDSHPLNDFILQLSEEISRVIPEKMLHPGIHQAYNDRMQKALSQKNVQLVKHSSNQAGLLEGRPTLACVDGSSFLQEPFLHEEVFGPYSLLVKCKDMTELVKVWVSLKGQLSTSLMATDEDLANYPSVLDTALEIAGRVVFNQVPTGVEVCSAMMHGGSYPASTDSRFSAVGIHAVKRWLRPVCFQNCPSYLLPDELKDDNPGKIWRSVNNVPSKDKI